MHHAQRCSVRCSKGALVAGNVQSRSTSSTQRNLGCLVRRRSAKPLFSTQEVAKPNGRERLPQNVVGIANRRHYVTLLRCHERWASHRSCGRRGRAVETKASRRVSPLLRRSGSQEGTGPESVDDPCRASPVISPRVNRSSMVG